MSRFFRAGNDSSDSEPSSPEEEEPLSDGESGSEAPAPVVPQRPIARFLKKEDDGSSSRSDSDDDDDDHSDGKGSDSENERPRTVKSAFQRRQEETQGIENAIENALKINHWNAISNAMSPLSMTKPSVSFGAKGFEGWDGVPDRGNFGREGRRDG
ncbi:hypothetical protein FRC09_017774 [Ceratobasidium sp. 395]|nr:hypothetical protein FRC09_017774 [Ceratobasidium sp. 395]